MPKVFYRTIVFLLIALLLGVAAWSLFTQRGSSRPLIVGGPKNISMLVLIAEDQGFFQAEGIEVEFRPIQTGKLTMDSLGINELDVGVLVDTNIAYLGFRSDVKARVIASIASKTDDALIARSDRGIQVPADLEGRTIAYLPATTSDSFLWRFLRKHGISTQSVTLLSMPPPAMQAAVVKGDVDAASIWQPFRLNAETATDGKLIQFVDPEVYVAQALLCSTDRKVREKSAELQGLLRALMRAEEFARSQQTAARRILADAIPMEESALIASWGDYDLRVELNRSILQLLSEESQHIVTALPEYSGRQIPNYESLIDPALLRGIDASRVTGDW